jgi:hypothetical protein
MRNQTKRNYKAIYAVYKDARAKGYDKMEAYRIAAQHCNVSAIYTIRKAVMWCESEEGRKAKVPDEPINFVFV